VQVGVLCYKWLQFGAVDAIGVLRTIPTKTVTIDFVGNTSDRVKKLIWILYWKSQALWITGKFAVEWQLQIKRRIDPSASCDRSHISARALEAGGLRDATKSPIKVPGWFVFEWVDPRIAAQWVISCRDLKPVEVFSSYLGRHFAPHGINIQSVVEHPSVLNLF
jgi:hypothetical protein